jgi:hypothetical protein
MEILVTACTAPTQSSYREVVEQKFAQQLNQRGKKFNVAAARYAVDMARDLDLINANNTWTDKGLLLAHIAEVDATLPLARQLDLTPPEQLCHFRLFLEGDGAALLFLSRRLSEHASLGNQVTVWNSLAREMFVEVFDQYLAITNDTADRVGMRRERDRINAKGYEGNSGAHKMFVHLQAMHRLGLAERRDAGGSRVYEGTGAAISERLASLIHHVPDTVSLEKIVSNHQCIEVAARVYGFAEYKFPLANVGQANDDFLSLMAQHYARIMRTGVPLCPLTTLVEVVQIDLLMKRRVLLPYHSALETITKIQRQRPKQVRFHVDRKGMPAFIKLSM